MSPEHRLQNEPDGQGRRREPISNVPPIVFLLILALAGVHLWRTEFVGLAGDERVVETFAFISGCYLDGGRWPCAELGSGHLLWSPVTYAFLHGDWMHLGLNTIWLLAFGTPVARRLGAGRFLLFCAAGSVAGAAVFLLTHPHGLDPVIGASGIVSALMGGACRFAFGGPGAFGPGDQRQPRLAVRVALAYRTVVFFIRGCFGSNLLTASGLGAVMGGGDAPIAWEAHLGGFAFGFLLFALFDRPAPRRPGPGRSA